MDEFQRLGRVCTACGEEVAEGDAVQIDHIVAVSRSGTDERTNLRVVHKFCNLSKGSKTDEDYAALVVARDLQWNTPDYDGEALTGEPLHSFQLSDPEHTITMERVERGLFGLVWLVRCSCGWAEAQPIRPEVDALVASMVHDYDLTHLPPASGPLQLADHAVETSRIRAPGYDGWPTDRWLAHCVCGFHTVANFEEDVDAAVQAHWDSIGSD